MKTRLIEIRKGVLSRNDEEAATLRERFAAAGTFVVNLVSSPGAGKTALLEQTLRLLRAEGFSVAALVGDLETDNDARRLLVTGAPVRQIRTAGNCHLEAEMVGRFLEGWRLEELDWLFIENVGNLVCPANYDLGETLRVVLLSTPEGEDKPLKYPPMFNSADLAVITKIDLAAAVAFDRDAVLDNLARVHPGMPVIECSARSGEGLEAWIEWLRTRRDLWIAERVQVVEAPVLARESLAAL